MDVNRIKEEIAHSMDSLKGYFIHDPVVGNYFKDPSQVEDLVAITKRLITTALEQDFSTDSLVETSIDELSKEYIKRGFPYVTCLSCMDRVKNSIVADLRYENLDLAEAIRERFEYVKNYVAKNYVLYELETFDAPVVSVLLNDAMCKMVSNWFETFRGLILSGRYDEAVAFSLRGCDFARIKESWSYKTKCMNEYICRTLEKHHDSYHEYAKNFAYLMSVEDYVAAYLALVELKGSYTAFSSALEKLLVVFREDTEGVFFRFVEDIASSSEEKLLLLVGVKNLKRLNSVYSKDKIREILDGVELFLHGLTEDKKDFTVAKGIGGDFLLLSVGSGDFLDFLRERLESCAGEIADRVGLEGFKPEFVLVGFSLEPFLSITSEDMRKALYHLKMEALKRNLDVYVVDKEARIEVVEFLNRKFRNIQMLSQVLNEGKVEAFFQPIFGVDNNSADLVSVEALARLSTDGRYVSAGVFIDIIYELDLVEKLDELMLERIRGCKDHLATFCRKVSINISPRSLKSEGLVNKLLYTCDELLAAGVTPVVELTEQVIMENLDVVLKLSGCCSVKFSVDDFGVGFSSLRTVADLADSGVLESIKIDGSLVKNIDKEKVYRMIRIIVTMAKELNVATVAEFVENKMIMDELKKLGVDRFQGYYLGMPEPITALLAKYAKVAS